MSENLKELKKFSEEIDESEISILYSTQRVKAEEYLTKKLKDTIEHNKEKCSMICAENMKLEAETSHTQKEITSLLVTQNALNGANIEYKKNILKAEEEKQDILENVKNTVKKYDDLWEESRARYESLPHVQKLLKAKQDVRDTRENIRKLEIAEKDMIEQIRKKEDACRALDRERIIKFAEYMVIERPKLFELIKVRTAEIQEIQEQINKLKNKKKIGGDEHNEESKANNQRTSIMPRLQLNHFDMDEIRRDDFINTAHNSTYSIHSVIVIDPTKTTKKNKTPKIDNNNYLSTFFYKPNMIFNSESNKIQDFNKKKLINILKDIKIDENQAKMIIADVNTEELQPTETIAVCDKDKRENIQTVLKSKDSNILENDEIEEIDMTASHPEELVEPPSQFMDMTQASQKEQVEAELDQAPTAKTQESHKKQVTFDLSHIEPTKNNDGDGTSRVDNDVTNNSQLDISHERFTEIKSMMKRRNLDLSPQFIYAKNDMTPKKPGELVFTSKFFPQEKSQNEAEKIDMEVVQDDREKEANMAKLTVKENHTSEMDIVSSPKRAKVSEIEPVPSVSEFMLGLDVPMTSTCIEESMNATGYEDDDGDLSYADPSFLLSPKDNNASMQMETQEASQDMPNFFSGQRKMGLSFFENMGATNSKPDSAHKPGTSGFSFKFGNNEKKNGFFSMFQ